MQFNEIINILIPVPTILEDDGYSIYICDCCREKAKDSYDFRQVKKECKDQFVMGSNFSVF